jgi:hypothetical protein
VILGERMELGAACTEGSAAGLVAHAVLEPLLGLPRPGASMWPWNLP